MKALQQLIRMSEPVDGLDLSRLFSDFEEISKEHFKTVYIPMYKNDPDFGKPHNLTLDKIKEETVQLLTKTTLDGQYAALNRVLGDSSVEGFMISPKLIWNDSLLYEYRRPPKFLRSGVEVPIQDGHSFALLDSERGNIASWFATTSMFPPLVEGIPLIRNAIMSKKDAIRVAGLCPCIRHEAPSDCEAGWRESIFLQTFFERFSNSNELNCIDNSDSLESLSSLVDLLAGFGIPNRSLRVRLNSFRTILLPLLRVALSQESACSFARFRLNPLAYSLARGEGHRPEILAEVQRDFFERAPDRNDIWQILRQLIISGRYDYDSLLSYSPLAAQSLIDLNSFANKMKSALPEVTWEIDPLSTRLAYDDLHFQFDVTGVHSERSLVEVGGGGNYSRAAQLAWEIRYHEPAPARLKLIGAGIGNMRVATARESLG